MVPTEKLRKVALEGVEYIRKQAYVLSAEVFVSAITHILTRINYTSSILCNGVEEPKSISSFGVGVQVVIRGDNKRMVGFGSSGGDLSIEGIKDALEKARVAAVEDPDFHGLPVPARTSFSRLYRYDEELMHLNDEILVGLGWKGLEGAICTFRKEAFTESLIVGGDINVIQERMAVVNTEGIDAIDEAAYATASITAMIEHGNAKGSGWELGVKLKKFSPEKAGEMAAQSAIASKDGRSISSGKYNVILGPQAVADLLSNIVLPSLTLSIVDAASSTFTGRYGKTVTDSRLSIYDDGASEGLPLSKRYTCEGLPTGVTELIRDGILVGFLSNNYYTNKVLHDPASREKIGVSPNSIREAITPRNGFRPYEAIFRNFKCRPAIVPTNVIVESSEVVDLNNLLTTIQNGLYVGRIWYTYPINGLLAGDFTCTVIGDSYLIENGKITDPLKPNSVRISDNIHTILNRVAGVTGDKRPVLLWGAPEVIYAPHIWVHGVSLHAIG